MNFQARAELRGWTTLKHPLVKPSALQRLIEKGRSSRGRGGTRQKRGQGGRTALFFKCWIWNPCNRWVYMQACTSSGQRYSEWSQVIFLCTQHPQPLTLPSQLSELWALEYKQPISKDNNCSSCWELTLPVMHLLGPNTGQWIKLHYRTMELAARAYRFE